MAPLGVCTPECSKNRIKKMFFREERTPFNLQLYLSIVAKSKIHHYTEITQTQSTVQHILMLCCLVYRFNFHCSMSNAHITIDYSEGNLHGSHTATIYQVYLAVKGWGGGGGGGGGGSSL